MQYFWRQFAKTILDGLETTESEISSNVGLTCNSNKTAHSLFLQLTDAVEVVKLISTPKVSEATGSDYIIYIVIYIKTSIYVILVCHQG